MVQYLARYTENLSQRTFHMRSQLKSNVVFTWEPEYEKKFNELKKNAIITTSDTILQSEETNGYLSHTHLMQ